RMLPARHQQPLRQVNLKTIAGVDVLDPPADHFAVALGREVARHARMARQWILRAESRAVGPAVPDTRTVRHSRTQGSQGIENLAQSESRSLTAGFGSRFRKSRRNQPRSLLLVIKSQNPVIQTGDEQRHLELVAARPGKPFDVVTQLVTEQS